MAATKRRGKRRASTSKRGRSSGRKTSTSHGVSLKVNPKRRRSGRRNPVVSRSRRRGGRRRRNPVGGGVLKEAFYYSVAAVVLPVASPFVNRLIGGFLPLGQFTQPVVFAATGFGLAWLAGFGPAPVKQLQRPLAIVGVALGITAIITPWARRLFSTVGLQADAGMSGYRPRNMRGLAAVTGIPPNILPPPPPAPAVNGMSGIAAYGGRGY